MAIKWKSGINVDDCRQVLKRICESASVDEQKGTVSFRFSNDRHEGIAVLQTMLRFPRGINYDSFQERTTITLAVNRAALDNDFTPHYFLTKLNEIAGKDNQKPEAEYRLVTSLSVDASFPIKSWSFDRCSVRLLSGELPQKYKSRASKIQDSARKFDENHPDYVRCIISVRAKNERSAAHKALRALDIFRGYCNLLINPQFQRIFASSTEIPVNAVRAGQCHTLHRENGVVLDEQLWYEPNFRYTSPVRTRAPKELRQYFRRLNQLVDNCPYSSKLIDSLLRYVRALDETDFNTSFLRLWAAIECLACPNDEGYQVLIRRCAFLYEDSNYQKLVLNHLREYRNSNIHAGEERDNVREYLFQAQRFYRALFGFHTEHTHLFSKLDEANSFLDLPTDSGKLLKLREQIDYCIKSRKINTD